MQQGIEGYDVDANSEFPMFVLQAFQLPAFMIHDPSTHSS